MNKLKDEELVEIEGGALKMSGGFGFALGGVIVFTIGVISGWLRPLNCSNK